MVELGYKLSYEVCSHPLDLNRGNMEDTKTQYHVFYGDDEDYGYPYVHKYNEPDSDRGASDEGWEEN